jgi:hypothetical protein
MQKFALSLVISFLICSHSAALEVSPTAKEAVKTIRELRAIGIPAFEDGYIKGGPPPRVPGLLRQLNKQLKDLIIETLNDASRNSIANADEILEKLRAAGWDEIPDHKWNAYGEIIRIKFDWPLENHPGILIVSTQLWIPCGSNDPDAAIYVLQGKARDWKLLIATDADFANATGPLDGEMEYKVSPPDPNGAWYLAIATSPPSCHSPAESARFKVLRVGQSPEEPKTLLVRREVVDQEFDPPFRLRAETNWMAITRGKNRKLDGDRGVAISRYEVAEGSVTRIQPLALTPEDFLDEWVQIDWNEAIRWSNESSHAGLRDWHSRLNGLARDSAEFEGIFSCANQDKADETWLVKLTVDRQLNPSFAEETLNITLTRRNGDYFVEAINRSRPAGCSNEAIHRAPMELKLPEW